ncbi:multidrug resistance-associated protein 4 [Elysia marginata]|uniref:Cystic fibrosis transmembrane conductance regulator n=1 Tax=Elysia marginata TaxID=1093978 RepID=A0AAV4J0J6_9GAST|nr:multidrug resistance-associated protein 4 [Elysia marginata]
MDESLRHDNPNPTLTANYVSKMLFWWLNPLFNKGYKGWLEESDMYNVTPNDSSETTGEIMQAAWNKELEKQKHGKQASLLRSLFRAFGWKFMWFGVIVLFEEIIKLCQPVLLAELLDYFRQDSTTTTTEAWLYATGVIFCSVILAVVHHPYFFGASRLGMRARIGLCSLMYRKCLRLSNKSLNESSVGQIVNLMSNDVARFDQGMPFFHFLWMGPMQCLIALTYLWIRLGPQVLAALTVVLLLMPTQLLMGKLFSRLRRKTAVHTDKRVKVMNEIISGIRIIKLYCWEKPFGRLVEKLRSLEVSQLRRTRRVQASVMGPFFTTSQLSVLLFVLAYVLTGKEDEIRPGTVFLVMGVVQCLRLTCGLFLPLASQHLAETLVVIKRIENFLLLEELKKLNNQQPTNEHVGNGFSSDNHKTNYGVDVTNLTAKWDGNSAISNTLEDISMAVRPGDLVAVIGPVGSGKTSLLMSILGELPAQIGTVRVRGKIAYVSQHPWIFSGSLRQNILFGQAFNKTRYDKVIRISALSRDLSILPKGDATLIGDRGVNLSGGQKARVSLARALYMDADIYLLDDPLAAVDTTVGKHIFDKCIMQYLKDKPRILVTHQVQLLPVADEIIILTDGKVLSHGTFSELSKSGVDFSELLKLSEEETSEMYGHSESFLEKQDKPGPTTDSAIISESKRSRANSLTSVDSLGEDYVPDSVQLPEEEERETGAVDLQVFFVYFKSGAGIVLFVSLVLFLVLAQVLYVISDWWLAKWTTKLEDRHNALVTNSQLTIDSNTTAMGSAMNTTLQDIPEVDTYFNLYVYAGFILALIVSSLTRAFLFFKMAVTAGKNLHNMMFARILRTTMAFFDTNPVGRVLNRFSKDTGQIDDLVPWTMFDVIQNCLLTLGIVIVAAVLNPWVFIPVVPLLILFIIVRRYYVQTSRSVKRLEGTTRSPVFSYLSATLQGLHTIRAMHMEQQLTREFDAHQDLHTEAWFLFLATSRWLGIRLDWLSVTFIACVVYFSVVVSDSMDPGFVGLSVVYTMNLMGLFQWAVRQTVELENQMISVERVLQYTRLPIEADLESKHDQKPPDTWPSSGSLQAKGVSLRYSPSAPFVLKDINFDIHGGEKIGIVGRTGAGKSSLITALFRLAEPEGELTIDGVSIHSLGLHDLRKVISIIPQDPVLFTGSVRRNLDPFDEYSDSQLWTALEEVQLKEAITSNPDSLYMEVTEGGSNFSAGQRQLMCLARAVLGNTRILLIDEATANVDPITDELIQQTIRSKFKTCTVLTVAHRLHTIIDSDRIMVLDAGEIVEMDTPFELLTGRENGVFYSMVEQMGKAELEHLTELASKGHSTNNISKPQSPKANGVSHSPSSLTLTPAQITACLPEVKVTNGEIDLCASGIDNDAFTPDSSEVTRL